MKVSLLISMVFVLGCGDDLDGGSRPDGGAGGADAGAAADAAIQCDAPAAGAPGSSCGEDAECDSAEGAGDGRCLIGNKRGVDFPETGYCVRQCGDAADCGAGTACITQAEFPMRLCLAACCDGAACAGDNACTSTIGDEDIGAAVCLP